MANRLPIYFLGFAIKIKRDAYNYTQKLEDFVYDLWLAGEETGQKIQPPEAVEKVKHATNGENSSELLFSVDEWPREPNIR